LSRCDCIRFDEWWSTLWLSPILLWHIGVLRLGPTCSQTSVLFGDCQVNFLAFWISLATGRRTVFCHPCTWVE
jgi:hypothetical protein